MPRATCSTPTRSSSSSRRPDGTLPRRDRSSGFAAEAIGSAIRRRRRVVGLWPARSSRTGRSRRRGPAAGRRPGGDARPAAWPADRVGEAERRADGHARSAPIAPFTELDCGIADLLATQIAIALQNAELHARVREAAVRDPLTGLLNRRFFDEAVETAFADARRAGTELSLIVLDLDRFTEVNNDHGHAGRGRGAPPRRPGDGRRRRATGDVVARYGGEEFVVIAPGTERATDAVGLAERIRAAVAAEALTPVDGLVVPLTISAGVASRLGRRGRRPGALPGRGLGAARGEARRPRPGGQRLGRPALADLRSRQPDGAGDGGPSTASERTDGA